MSASSTSGRRRRMRFSCPFAMAMPPVHAVPCRPPHPRAPGAVDRGGMYSLVHRTRYMRRGSCRCSGCTGASSGPCGSEARDRQDATPVDAGNDGFLAASALLRPRHRQPPVARAEALRAPGMREARLAELGSDRRRPGRYPLGRVRQQPELTTSAPLYCLAIARSSAIIASRRTFTMSAGGGTGLPAASKRAVACWRRILETSDQRLATRAFRAASSAAPRYRDGRHRRHRPRGVPRPAARCGLDRR